MRLPTIDDIQAAATRIRPLAVYTPLIESAALNAQFGGRVLMKLETLQRVGAFKFRGAYNKISQLDKAQFPGGVVACSSGNHAQGVADAATILGFAATIVMPHDAPAVKIARTRALGAEIVAYDRASEDRVAISERLAERLQAAMVPPYDDLDIVAGQGTAGLEIVQQAAALGAQPDVVLVPCGGGGLVSGIATAIHATHARCRVVAVEPEGFDDTKRSLESGRRQQNALKSGSICDALLSSQPGVITFAVSQREGVSGCTVCESDVRAAVRYAFHELKLVVEPGGAVGLAAVLSGAIKAQGQVIVCVLSGGNVDPALFASIIGGN